MNPSDVWERLLVAGLSRDFQQMRLDFLRRLSRRKGAKEDPQGAVADWAEHFRGSAASARCRRAQGQGDVAPPSGADRHMARTCCAASVATMDSAVWVSVGSGHGGRRRRSHCAGRAAVRS